MNQDPEAIQHLLFAGTVNGSAARAFWSISLENETTVPLGYHTKKEAREIYDIIRQDDKWFDTPRLVEIEVVGA